MDNPHQKLIPGYLGDDGQKIAGPTCFETAILYIKGHVDVPKYHTYNGLLESTNFIAGPLVNALQKKDSDTGGLLWLSI